MISWVILVGGALAFAAANRLRGMVGALVAIPAALVGLSVWWISGLPWLGVALVVAAYVGGESWGWTKWINCIKMNLTQAQYNAKWQYPKEVDAPNYEYLLHKVRPGWDNRDYQSYVWTGMVIRGALWWAPVYAVLWRFGMAWPVAVGATVLVSLLFPILYHTAWRTDVGDFKYLQKAEVIYGFAYGLVFLAATVLLG